MSNVIELNKSHPMGKFLRIFYGVDMRCSHEGLAQIAHKGNKAQKGMDVNELKEGQFCLFLNNKLNRFKIYATNNVVAYLRVKTGKIDMNTIQLIPAAFNGGSINYDAALRQRITKHFEKRGVPMEILTEK